jgi:dihydroorotate dehydrogenase (NAD+) catalytic subunit
MTIALTRPDKQPLLVERPVMNAAGTLGWAEELRQQFALDTLGALVTNPITLAPRLPAGGTRIVPLEAGLLLHTGLPNAGARRTVEQHEAAWGRLPVPLIAHVAAGAPDELVRVLDLLDGVDVIAGIELGVQDDIRLQDAMSLLRAAQRTEKPLLFRLPFGADADFARAAADAGAGGLTVCAPPRGTARDGAGRLVAGRLDGTWVFSLTLRLVGQIARAVDVPVVAAGGIHSAADARTFIEAGAVAVQLDSLLWARPAAAERIARDLGGLQGTQPASAQ